MRGDLGPVIGCARPRPPHRPDRRRHAIEIAIAALALAYGLTFAGLFSLAHALDPPARFDNPGVCRACPGADLNLDRFQAK